MCRRRLLAHSYSARERDNSGQQYRPTTRHKERSWIAKAAVLKNCRGHAPVPVRIEANLATLYPMALKLNTHPGISHGQQRMEQTASLGCVLSSQQLRQLQQLQQPQQLLLLAVHVLRDVIRSSSDANNQETHHLPRDTIGGRRSANTDSILPLHTITNQSNTRSCFFASRRRHCTASARTESAHTSPPLQRAKGNTPQLHNRCELHTATSTSVCTTHRLETASHKQHSPHPGGDLTPTPTPHIAKAQKATATATPHPPLHPHYRHILVLQCAKGKQKTAIDSSSHTGRATRCVTWRHPPSPPHTPWHTRHHKRHLRLGFQRHMFHDSNTGTVATATKHQQSRTAGLRSAPRPAPACPRQHNQNIRMPMEIQQRRVSAIATTTARHTPAVPRSPHQQTQPHDSAVLPTATTPQPKRASSCPLHSTCMTK